MRVLGALLLLCGGCAAEFSDVSRESRRGAGGLAIGYCGSTGASVASVIQAMDNPGGADSGPLPTERELTVCLSAENRGGQPVRIDRSHIRLKCPREKQEWVPDRDEEVLLVPAGGSQKFRVTFRYAPVQHGEQVAVQLDALHLPPILLRRN